MPTTTPRVRKRQRYHIENENVAKLSSAMQTMVECRKTLSQEDECEAFGNLIATMTRQLKTAERMNLHVEIMTVVQRYFAQRSSAESGRDTPLQTEPRTVPGRRGSTPLQTVPSRISIGTTAGTSGTGSTSEEPESVSSIEEITMSPSGNTVVTTYLLDSYTEDDYDTDLNEV